MIPASSPAPAWTVTSEGILHTLLYQGQPQSTSRLGAGVLREMAARYNAAGTVPKKSRKRCAADHPQPEKFLASKTHHSPALPFPPAPTQTTTTNPTITMPAKAKPFSSPAVDSLMPPVEFIPASQFRRYPSNRIIPAEQTAKMSDSIRQVGVLQPITARPVSDGENGVSYEIVIGESRWLGCSDLDPQYPIPTFVRQLTDKEAAKIHTVENFQRKDLDDIEEARAIQHLKDTGWTIDEIITFLGREKSHIYLRLTLLKLGESAHQAIREGNLTLRTAEKLAGIPEDQREAALAAVITPTHAAKALPERQAIELLEREYIEPLKQEKEWDKRRDAILQNHPGAKWNPYPEARKLDMWDSGFVRADRTPPDHLLSDAAREGELLIPTWGDLAKKHGAPFHIGCNYSDEAHAYVEQQPLIDAEKAACSPNPEDCIFLHEAAVHQAREAAAQRRLQLEAHQAALHAERTRICALLLSPDGLTKTATKKLIETAFLPSSEEYHDLQDIALALDLGTTAEDWQSIAETAILKYLRSKTLTPFEAVGRLRIATWVASAYPSASADLLFESGAIRPADFPAYHKEYSEGLARQAAARRDAAAGQTSNQEETAA